MSERICIVVSLIVKLRVDKAASVRHLNSLLKSYESPVYLKFTIKQLSSLFLLELKDART